MHHHQQRQQGTVGSRGKFVAVYDFGPKQSVRLPSINWVLKQRKYPGGDSPAPWCLRGISPLTFLSSYKVNFSKTLFYS